MLELEIFSNVDKSDSYTERFHVQKGKHDQQNIFTSKLRDVISLIPDLCLGALWACGSFQYFCGFFSEGKGFQIHILVVGYFLEF